MWPRWPPASCASMWMLAIVNALRKPAAAFDAALTQAGVPHEFHIFPGRHIEAYWNNHLPDYLRFYTQEWGT